MLISEIYGRHYFISRDNPVPADSSAMLEVLGAIGKTAEWQSQTTVALSSQAATKWRDVCNAIKGTFVKWGLEEARFRKRGETNRGNVGAKWMNNWNF